MPRTFVATTFTQMGPTELKKLLDRAQKLRADADALEKKVLRAALAASHGMPTFAAELLGINRQTVKDWLRRQHADVGAEARAMRTKEGYKGGNPHMYPFMSEGKAK